MKTLLLAISVLLSTTIIHAQDLKPWKINLPSGVSLQVQTKSNQSIAQEAMGQNIEMQNQTEVAESIQLQTNPDKTLRLEKQMNSMRIQMSMMGQDIKFDSNNPDDLATPMGLQIKPILARVVTATIDASGNILVSSAPIEDANISAALAMFDNGGPDSLALAALFMKAPAQVIRSGESWTEVYQSSGMKQETKYTYLETKDQLASIAFEISSAIEKSAEMQGTTVQTNTKTQAKGTLKLDIRTGLVVYRTIEQTVEGVNNVMGMEIPLKGGGKTEVTVSRVN